jgi:HAD superfamily hydrolase (TIGR01549 family)
VQAVLFDMDGTLVDSFRAHLAIYRATLKRFGVALDARRFRRLYSPNWHDFYRQIGLPRAQWEAASREWLRQAARHEPRPFPGIAKVLRSLRRSYELGVVTAGSASRVRADLERGGLSGSFSVVVTADDVREPKPSPEGLELALRTLGLAPNQALYVGDTESDYVFSREAGVPFVSVTSGFSRHGRHPAYPRLGTVTDLPQFLNASRD